MPISDETREKVSSPRAWGCFLILLGNGLARVVFPTCVGVFLCFLLFTLRKTRLPHVRGGVSYQGERFRHRHASSPRAWGCFPVILLMRSNFTVFPTCVGVFLAVDCGVRLVSRLPHVRGGVSIVRVSRSEFSESSPRAWGCFGTGLLLRLVVSVFPTCVGVFPPLKQRTAIALGLPHVRGGVSCFHY